MDMSFVPVTIDQQCTRMNITSPRPYRNDANFSPVLLYHRKR